MIIKEINRVEITVIVDNYTDLLRMDNNQVVKRPSLSYGEVLLAEHGLSLYITLWADGNLLSILMDAGASDICLQYNATRLGVNLGDISALVISHGHDDHVGSLKEILKAVAGPVPVYIHPGSFSRRQKRIPGESLIEMNPPDIATLKTAGAEFHMNPGQTKVWDKRIVITGEIERTTEFEQVNPVYYVEESGTFVPDLFHDDQAVILCLKEKGLIVITGCAHSGIINTIRYARKITGVDKVFVVMGGFHLSGSFFSTIINPTIDALKEINPQYIIPMHCTGWEAIARVAEEMPNQVLISTVGTKYTFGE